MAKLTRAQEQVMKWLGKNWRAEPSYGSVWTINGGAKRQGVTCSTTTLTALEKKGLTQKDNYGCWIATDAGKQLVQDLDL